MAGLQELALEIYIVMLCLNAGVLIVDSSVDVGLVTPFDLLGGNVTGITDGPVTGIYNSTDPTGTLTGNLTSGQGSNSTIGGDSSTLNPIDSLLFPLTVIWSFIQFITGGFIFQVLGLFGLPDIFIYSLQGIIGILLARLIIYYVWGR